MKRRDYLLALLALLALWQILAWLVNQPILPDPWRVLRALVQETLSGDLPRHFLASLWRVVASTLLSILLAAPAGLVLGQSRRLNRSVHTHDLPAVPHPQGGVCAGAVALLRHWRPLENSGYLPHPLFPDSGAGARSSRRPASRVDSFRAQSGRRQARPLPFRVPARQPAGILTALRQSIGTAVAVLYVAELFATRVGLGYYIYFQGSTLLNYPAMYAGILAMSFLGLGLYFLVDGLERRLCRWQIR